MAMPRPVRPLPGGCTPDRATIRQTGLVEQSLAYFMTDLPCAPIQAGQRLNLENSRIPQRPQKFVLLQCKSEGAGSGQALFGRGSQRCPLPCRWSMLPMTPGSVTACCMQCNSAREDSSRGPSTKRLSIPQPQPPQNKKYRCASGSTLAGSQVSSTPSARTS